MTAPKKQSGVLHITAPNEAQDLSHLIDLLCKTYSPGLGYWDGERKCRDGYILRSNYDWNASRVGKLGDLIVTHFGIWKFHIRVGRARLCVAGVGAVATHEYHRMRGLMRATTTAALESLSESEYDVCLLYGIPNFYEKFGFRRAWTPLVATVEIDWIPTKQMPGRLERSRASARADLATLYNKENANLTGTAVHPTFPLRNVFVECDAYVWNRGQKVKGFVFVSGSQNTLNVKAWAGDPVELLTVVRSLAIRSGVRVVQFETIHHASKLSRFLRRRDCTFKSEYRSSSGPMIRIVSLRRTITRLRPELEDRLRKSHLSGWSGDLLLENNREAVTLRIVNGKANVVAARRCPNSISGGEEIAQLLLGTDDPNEVVEAGGIKLRGQASALVPVLFPNEYPALSAWDRF